MDEEEEYIPMSSPNRSEERERREAKIFRAAIMRGIALTENSEDDTFYPTQMSQNDPIDWLTPHEVRRPEFKSVLLGSAHYGNRRNNVQKQEVLHLGEKIALHALSSADLESPGGDRRNQQNRGRKVAAMNGTSADLLAFLRLQHSGELVADNQPIEAIPPKEHLSSEHMQMLINWQTTSNVRRTKLDIGACVVCESDKAGYHFGVTACAACSAFFRRTISERRKYVCRKTGTDHLRCPIDKRHRCYCRACRLQKCLAQGMDPNAVQPHRDSIGAKTARPSRSSPIPPDNLDSIPCFSHNNNNNNNEMIVAKPECFRPDSSLGICATTLLRASPEMVVPKEETEEGFPQDSMEAPSAPESVLDRPSSAFSSSSDGSPYDPHQNIIEIMVEQYSKLLERRRLVYCPSSIHAILSGAPPLARPAKMFDRVRRHHIRIEIGLFVEFLNCIHPFPKLPLDDKVALMKHLSVSFSILEKYYATMRGGGLETNRIIHSDGTYTDLDNPSSNEFDTNEVSGQKTDRETLNKLFITPLRDALREISGPMFHYNMTDVEFCALTAILLFDPSAVGLMDATRRLVKDARDRVYQDWFSFYRAHGVSDACQRVGNTMLLLPAVQTTVEKTAENFTLIRIFELFEYDKILDELFSKDSSQFSSDFPPQSDLDS